jgi:hypothetical protein
MRLSVIFRAAATAFASLGVLAAGCGQDGVVLPEQGGGEVGECGTWYPGGGAADAGIEYGSNQSETLPCFVWESVRSGAQESGADPATYANAYLSMGEIFLKSKNPNMGALLEAQFGVAEAKAILFAIVAKDCSGCPEFLGRVVASLPELQAAGVVVVGVASFLSNDSNPSADAMDLVAADEILINDGFDPSLHRTNDPEHYVGENGSFGEGFPQIIAVRVSDMTVAVRGIPQGYYPTTGEGLDVAKLLNDIDSFVAE